MLSPALIANDLKALAATLDLRVPNAHIVSIKRGAMAILELRDKLAISAALGLSMAQAVAEDVHELAETAALFRPNGQWDLVNVEIEGRLLQRARLLIAAKQTFGNQLEVSPLAADVIEQVRLRGLAE